MSSTTEARPGQLRVRKLVPADLDEVIRIDAVHRGDADPGYWHSVLGRFLTRRRSRRPTAEDTTASRPVPIVQVAIGVDGNAEQTGLAGYLFGEVRAVEFGSEPCGWIFAVGVDRPYLRSKLASALLREATARFQRAGVRKVRTMVQKSDVPVLSFFRASGFVGGPFVQLELDLEQLPRPQEGDR